MATPLGGYVPPILQQSPAGKAARVASITRGDAHLAVVNAKIAALRNEAGLGPSAEELEDERRKTDAEEKQNYWLTVGHAVFASVSMVSSLICLRLASWGITRLAFTIPLAVAPYAVRQRRQLNRKVSLRVKLNKLRDEVNVLYTENQILIEETNKIEGYVSK